ncbi:MAG TPA: M1 family metallopeptidase, partial [Longimicrobiaceae bacterium]|nr:M1 family metallopeptidase [Longimicrobiaceae bacterium]
MGHSHLLGWRFVLALAALLLPTAVQAQGAVRLPDGRPGLGYWQQQVDYSVEARLEPAVRRLTGRARITYHNASPDTLRELHWHLYQNIFRADSRAGGAEQILGRRMTATRGITVHRVAAAGQPLDREIAGTLMRTPLREPLLPRDSLVLQVEWEYEVPPIPSLRTGSRGEDFGMAQWYPQIAVYDDRHGWNDTPYLGTGEFYLEYGRWDARITVPSDYIVAATGTLRNPEQLLTPAQLRRLREVSRGRVTQVVTAAEIGTRGVSHPAERTWHFTARDVRDFAWAASPNFVWDATRTAPLPLQPTGVWIHSFYRADEARDYHWSAAVARQAIEYWSRRFGPYLYPQATVVSGPVEGMEYPMLAFGGPGSRVENQPLMVIVHELAHQWYPMMLGTHETRYPAMDEGMTTFITSLALEELFGRNTFWSPRLPYFARGILGRGDERRILQAAYLLDAGGDSDFPLLTHAHELNEWQLGLQVYVKTASVLFMLQDLLGEETFHRAMHVYHERWRFKHPYPEDFFRTVEDVAGRDLGWFWQPWFRGTATLDLALRDISQEQQADGWRAQLTLENRGEAIMPATLRLTLRDGSVRDLRVPETVWMNGDRTHAAEITDLPARVRSAEIDPARILADVRRSNNVWPAGAPSAAGPLLGMHWHGILLMLLGAGLTVAAARVSGTFMSARRSATRMVRYGLGPLTLWTAANGLRAGWVGRLYGGGALSLPRSGVAPDELRRHLGEVAAGGAAGALMLAAITAFLVAALELAGRLALRPEGHYHLDSVLATVAGLALLSALLSL